MCHSQLGGGVGKERWIRAGYCSRRKVGGRDFWLDDACSLGVSVSHGDPMHPSWFTSLYSPTVRYALVAGGFDASLPPLLGSS